MPTTVTLTAPILDVNVLIGPDVPARRSTDLADVRQLQERYQIGHCLVRSSAAVRVSRQLGNAAVLALAGEPGVSPVVTASALHPDQLPGELAAAVRSGARAVWLEDGWDAGTVAASRLLRAVADTGLPLLVPHRRATDAARIGELTEPLGMPVVLVEARYPDYPEVIPALQRYPQLHLETSSLGSYRAIERMVRIAGHERILFGSGAPVRTPLSPIAAVLHADLPEPAKRAILAGNAAQLFGLDPGPATELRVTVPDRLFDVHGHFFPAPWEVPQPPEDSLLDELARYGIRTQVASSVPAIMGDLVRGNRRTVEICRSEPRQLGYLVAHPDDPDLAAEQLKQWGDQPGIVGVKVHTEMSGVPTRDRRVAELFRVLARYRRPVKIHNYGEGWPDALTAIARTHPELPIIIAHAGYHRPERCSIPVVTDCPNVYLELASSKADVRDARDLVAAADPARVLFGSDSPLINPAWVVGLYQDLGLPQSDLDRSYWDNAERLFGTCS
ncbi:MAG TPA: amidohydrolase family protein [Natronosporangium sp.]